MRIELLTVRGQQLFVLPDLDREFDMIFSIFILAFESISRLALIHVLRREARKTVGQDFFIPEKMQNGHSLSCQRQAQSPAESGDFFRRQVRQGVTQAGDQVPGSVISGEIFKTLHWGRMNSDSGKISLTPLTQFLRGLGSLHPKTRLLEGFQVAARTTADIEQPHWAVNRPGGFQQERYFPLEPAVPVNKQIVVRS